MLGIRYSIDATPFGSALTYFAYSGYRGTYYRVSSCVPPVLESRSRLPLQGLPRKYAPAVPETALGASIILFLLKTSRVQNKFAKKI